MPRLKSLLSNLILMGLAVGATVFVFELAVRVAIPEWTPRGGDQRFWRYDEVLGWAHRSNRDGAHQHPEFDVQVDINEFAMRDHPVIAEGVPNPRILLLGDSFGWGYGVEQHEGFADLLESSPEALTEEWEVVNASVSGYGTDQQLLWFEREGRKFDPDHVLLLFHPNDFLDNHKQSRYGYRKPLFQLDGDGLTLTNVPVERKHPVARLDRWLSQNFSLYLQFEALQDVSRDAWLSLFEREEERPQEQVVATSGPVDVAAAPAGVAAPAREPKSKTSPLDTRWHLEEEHLELTRRILARLCNSVHESGASLSVVSVRMVPHLRDVLEETLAELGVPHLALDDHFSARAARRDLHFETDSHWNASGHRVAAGATRRFLIEHGVLPSIDGETGTPGERDQIEKTCRLM